MEIINKIIEIYEKKLESVYLANVIKNSDNMSPKELIKYAEDLKKSIEEARNSISFIPNKETLKADARAIKNDVISNIQAENKEKIKQLESEKLKVISKYTSDKTAKSIDLEKMRDNILEKKRDQYSKQFKLIDDTIAEVKESIQEFNIECKDVGFLNYRSMSMNDINNVAIVTSTATKKLRSISNLSLLYSIFYLPLVVNMAPQVKYVYTGIILLLSIIFNKYIFGIVGAITVFFLAYKFLFEYANREVLSLAYSLIRDEDILKNEFENKIKKESDVKEITDKLLELTEFSDDGELKALTDKIDEQIRLLNEDEQVKKEVEEVENIDIQDLLENEKFDELYSTKVQVIEQYIEQCTAEFNKVDKELNKLAEDFKTIGNYINTSVVFKPLIEKDILYYDDLAIASNFVEAPQRPIYIPTLEETKYYIINYLTNVAPELMQIIIVDPLYLGRDYAELYDQRLEQEFNMVSSEIATVVEEIKVEIQNRVKFIRNLSITDYNINASKTGKRPLPYKTYVFVADKNQEELSKNIELLKILDVSHEYGIYLIFANELTAFKNIVSKYEPAGKELYSEELGQKVMETLLDAKINGVSKIIKYDDVYTKYMNGAVDWTGDATNGIDLLVGNLDGDTTKPYNITLGDDDPHCLVAGASGAGKSVFLDDMICSVLHKYSPEEVQIILLDFKVVTAAHYSGQYQAPHFYILSGTKDGAYALSIFEELLRMQSERQKIFKSLNMGIDKISDYNKLYKKGSLPANYEYMTRVLIVFDEYQAMYKGVPQKISDQITVRISQLASEARACGMHMLFCSQTTNAALPKDAMEQFKMRAALRCGKDVSNSIIGNDEAAELRGKGWVILNNSSGEKRLNKRVNVPYIPSEDLGNKLIALRKRGFEEKQFRYECEFFDEEESISEERLNYHLNRFPRLKASQGAVILGDRLDFSRKNEPIALQLNEDDGNNIVVVGSDTNQNAMIIKNILKQLKQKENVVFMETALDRQMHEIADINSLGLNVQEKMIDKNNFQDIAKTINKVVLDRLDNGWTDGYKLWYIIIGAHKSQEFIDKYGPTLTLIENIARRGPQVGVHILVYSREAGPVTTINKLSDYLISTALDESGSATLFGTNEATMLRERQALLLESRVKSSKFKIPQMSINKMGGTLKELFA